jgi:hypothetical protein
VNASRQEAEPTPLTDAVDHAVLRAWSAALAANEAVRLDVRRMANGLAITLDEVERLRQSGRASMAPTKVVGMLTDALRKRGHEPPA